MSEKDQSGRARSISRSGLKGSVSMREDWICPTMATDSGEKPLSGC